MGFGHSRIGQKLGPVLGGHGATPTRMDGQLAKDNALLLIALLDQSLGQRGRLSMGHYPAYEDRLKISRIT